MKKNSRKHPNTYVDLLISDHDKVKSLFKKFARTNGKKRKLSIVEIAITELKIHAQLEEEIVYPALREVSSQDLMNEADEEHHMAKVLIAELEDTDQEDDHYDAKFTVLGELVVHHIKEEEGEMFKHANKTDIQGLTRKFIERKDELIKEMSNVLPLTNSIGGIIR